jgi:hypothetical protein
MSAVMQNQGKANLNSTGRLPDFFIAGAPKCGTTSMYEWLSSHPQIFMPDKELCFFSQDIFPTQGMRGHIPSLAAYSVLFAPAQDLSIRCGDGTPKYLHSNQALNEIKRLVDNPRILILLRNPVDLAISYHSQMVNEGYELERDFAKAWARGINSKTGLFTSNQPEVNGKVNYTFWARIGARLEHLHSQFPSENIKIILLNEMWADPRQTYLDVLAFIGILDDGRTEFPAQNKRMRVKNIAIHHAALRVRTWVEPILGGLRDKCGGRGLGVLKVLNAWNSVPGSYSGIVTEAECKRVYLALRDDIARAERFLGGRKLVKEADKS